MERSLNDLELATINFYIFWKVEFYKKLFLIHKVRLLNQHQEFSLDAIAKNYALKFTGGTSIGCTGQLLTNL